MFIIGLSAQPGLEKQTFETLPKTLTLAQEGEHLFNSTEQIPSTVGAPATGTQKENNIQPNCLGEATVSGTSDL